MVSGQGTTFSYDSFVFYLKFSFRTSSLALFFLVCNGFIVLKVQFSSHTIHYLEQEWSYLRGGLTTLDRDYGWINNIHHDIGTHVIHHLFPQIPHYHLIEAVSVFSIIDETSLSIFLGG